ncbi:unnamed protein product [Triticum turgidum subsp. durum]|uniref:Uncharacterized protein n=1 Tax=Triticum turgidum subsp. durum TaxID=4567 RepID=A0A9R0WWZ2_TRITD|nr:unnamed protein product [Triticum turgidum subsp. durum]
MEAVKSLLKPKPTPQQQLREWQRRLRNEGRNIERQIRDVQKEEKKVEKAIRDAAKRGDMGSAKVRAGQGAGAVEEGGQPPLREQGPAQLHLHAPRRDRRCCSCCYYKL